MLETSNPASEFGGLCIATVYAFPLQVYLVLDKPIVTCESDQQTRTETDSGGHTTVLRKI